MRWLVLLVAVMLVGCGGKGSDAKAPETEVDRALAHVAEMMKAAGGAEEDTKTAVEAARAFFRTTSEAQAKALADCILAAKTMADVKAGCGAAFAAATQASIDKILQAQPEPVRKDLAPKP
jgi:hypothetical protein